MGSGGWIDLRLKADPMQAVCHGDAKGANILYCTGEGGEAVPLVYDFQYCGKGCVAKDLAYFFNVEASASEEQALLRRYHAELSGLLRTALAAAGQEYDEDDEEVAAAARYTAAALPAAARCSLSLLPLRGDDFPELPATVTWAGKPYHAPCANLWANKVRASPP